MSEGNVTVKNSEKTNKKKCGYKALFCGMVCGLCVLLGRVGYGCRMSKATKKEMHKRRKEPMLILCNHACAIDFGFLSMPIWPRKLSYVVAENMLYWPGFNMFVKKAGAITKKQYVADFTCIKNIKRYLDAGVSVMMFPEGKVTNDGKTGYISPTVGKLVKWLNYPVAIGITNGAAVSSPKWADHKMRRNRIIVDMSVQLEKEQLKSMTAEEIATFITEKLQHNDNLFQIENHLAYKTKRAAEGLENIFYVCPRCGASFSYSSQGDLTECSACGNKVRLRLTGELEPATEESVCFDRIDLWTAWEREKLAEEIKNNDDYTLVDAVTFEMENDEVERIIPVGEGTLTLTKEQLSFVGTKDGAPFEISFSLEFVPTMVAKPGTHVDMYDEDHTYRFVFKDRRAALLYNQSVELIYEQRHAVEHKSN